MKKITTLLILLFTLTIHCKPVDISLLKKEVKNAARTKDYEHSINILTAVTLDENISANDKYEAYLLKAHIYKTLFKYEHALHFLNEALTEGMKGTDTFTVKQRITAERALIYFDKQEFEQSEKLMNELEKTNYKSLTQEYLIYLYTQRGFFLLKQKNYGEAERYLDKALKIGLAEFPKDLPIVYGKQIELYHLTDRPDKRDEAYRKGMDYARRNGNIKYEFYLEEIMKNVFSSTKDYKNAFYHQKKCDSLFGIYSADIKGGKLELLEKQLIKQQYGKDLERKRFFFIIMLFFTTVLLILLMIFFKLYSSMKKKNMMTQQENKQVKEQINNLENRNR